jgi:L-ascorbate metabolism protein UlaG (beta-lactamase superfamily)
MELQYYGANCVRFQTKKANLVVDDNLASVGLKSVTKTDDIALFTAQGGADAQVKMVIDQPGEYEVSDVSIQGIGARAHMDEEDKQSATIFKLVIEDIRVAVLGHVHPDLSDNQLERLGTVDILITPVGGAGYTLDPLGALKLIKKIGPKIIIPTHYHDKAIKYPVPQTELTEAIKGLAMEPSETVPKLKLRSSDISDVAQLIVLERQ